MYDCTYLGSSENVAAAATGSNKTNVVVRHLIEQLRKTVWALDERYSSER
jgi:hypothetical protein